MEKNVNVSKNNPTMDEDYLFAASATDCTGLTPTPAHNKAEAESYDEIVHFRPSPETTKKKH